MFESLDPSLINWSRLQFAMTAMYHWIFVPLTLGITVIIAIMETIYYRTGLEKWKKTTKFWMKLFGINFSVGIATGLILEFEFGTNWSNYSWLVGDIFGAPLAIEGIVAFFLETTFIGVMVFAPLLENDKRNLPNLSRNTDLPDFSPSDITLSRLSTMCDTSAAVAMVA